MRLPISDWLIVTDILSRTVSELSQLIVQILDTLRFSATICGHRNNVRCSSWAHWKACSKFYISVNWIFFARCYGWGATSENGSKIDDFAPTWSVRPRISSRMGHPPPIIFALLVRPMNALQLCRWQFSHKETSSEVRFLTEIGSFVVLTSPLPLRGIGATYVDHLRLIGKRVGTSYLC